MRRGRGLLFLSIACFAAACGSRTGLLVPPGEEPQEAGKDASPADVTQPVDARPEADVFHEEDALPPLDVHPPPPDTFTECPDAASTLVYVITESNNLYSFYPPNASFTRIGTIACPAAPGMTPFSMAVDRQGIAYIVFNDGELFRVSTGTAACVPTGFAPNQKNFSTTFGMGFSTNQVGTGETLFLAGDGVPSLTTLDVKTFQIGTILPFSLAAAELTGTGGGGLFGFWDPGGSTGTDSAIVQIDKATGQVTNSSTLHGVAQGSGWAFAFWGGDFYTFTAPGASSVVTRYDPNAQTVTQVAATDEIIVGAGVSTCAPQQ
ncbi:MAG TPA: hypothetical protein VIF09_08300 [Polyangiaceae bacterium]